MNSFFQKIFKNSDLSVAIGLVSILGVMIVPVHPFFIDIFLSMGIALSIVLLLTAIYSTKSLDFSLFPSLLLITTLFRLSLNVATTRVILLRGPSDGVAAAGSVIQSFGEYVVGGNYAVGIIIFIILVIINFVVITKGAGRVAEVAARFTLDAMPGKQMSIDADLNAGMINEEEARRRRSEIAKEADFYGAMDGASKFVRGDAIAGILIVVVNMVGGILIGTFQQGMSFEEAASVFTLLTIGDGLVTQIPALIISTAAGIMVTRTATSTHFTEEISKQLLMKPKALGVSAGVMSVMAFIPGLPFVPFMIIALGLGTVAYSLSKKKEEERQLEEKKMTQQKLKPAAEKLESLLALDLLELEVGYGLIHVVDVDQNGDLLERISNIRKQFALDLGVIIPPLRIRDHLELKPGDYQILLKGVLVSSGSLMVGNLLAMDPGNVFRPVAGIPTQEPAFGLDALWILPHQKEEATDAGYTVVDLSTIIATHLTEVIRKNIHELLGRQELQSLLDGFKQTAPKVVDDLIPNVLSISTLLKVLKNLLKEGVSIRDLRTILETLGDYGVHTKDAVILTEHVRAALSRTITQKLMGPDGKLTLLTLDQQVEETIASSLIQTEQGPHLSVDPEFIRRFISELNQKASEMGKDQLIILCSPLVRSHVKSLVDRFIPQVVVLSHHEIQPNIPIQSYGTVRLAHAS